MEKIDKLPVTDYPGLENLAQKYKLWGVELKQYQDSNGSQGQQFSWREGCYVPIITVLAGLTLEHCSFCDGFPIGAESLEPIEHYAPKANYPLLAYDLENLYYCCDKCNSEANKNTYEESLRPDSATYSFDKYFYFDLYTGYLQVKENLVVDAPLEYDKAISFLKRYGINSNPKRIQARKYLFQDIKNHFKADSQSDERQRHHFKYRYIYDLVERVNREVN